MRVEHLPPPLIDDIVANRSLPIIGAGFSRNAQLPVGLEMPTWERLSQQLAADIPDYTFTTPVEAISAFEYEYTRTKLVERLHDCSMWAWQAPVPFTDRFASCPSTSSAQRTMTCYWSAVIP